MQIPLKHNLPNLEEEGNAVRRGWLVMSVGWQGLKVPRGGSARPGVSFGEGSLVDRGSCLLKSDSGTQAFYSLQWLCWSNMSLLIV